MSPRILIIEDSETQLKYLRDKLETKGFEVVAASDGIEGYQKVYETAPDLIIADVVMPNINGYQLCRMLKNAEDTQKIPIILLTILDKKIDKFWGKKSGAQLFLSKSIDFEELCNHITSVVKRYPINQEYKDHLQHQIVTRDSAQTHLNNVLNELLMKTIFSNEFRNLSDFLNYEKVMVEKIFSLLSSFMEYNIAGLFFTSPDTLGENILYLDTLGRNVSKRVLSDIHYDFFKKLAEHKEIKSPKFEIVRVLFGKEVEYEYSDFASKIVIPLIYDKKLIAVVRGVYGDDAIRLANALYDGGIEIVEMTYDQKDKDCLIKTPEVIRLLKKEVGDKVLVGTGTVLSVEQAKAVIDAGTDFIVSPDTNVDVIKTTVEAGIPSMPGALTPTEVMTAVRAGADFVKIFPISVMGAGYIKALKGPINNVPFIVTGGVNEKNVADFIEAGAIGAGVGGNLVSKKMIEEGKFDEITALAREYVKGLNR